MSRQEEQDEQMLGTCPVNDFFGTCPVNDFLELFL